VTPIEPPNPSLSFCSSLSSIESSPCDAHLAVSALLLVSNIVDFTLLTFHSSFSTLIHLPENMKPPIDPKAFFQPPGQDFACSIFTRSSSIPLFHERIALRRQHTWPSTSSSCAFTSNTYLSPLTSFHLPVSRTQHSGWESYTDRPHDCLPASSQSKNIVLLPGIYTAQSSSFTVHGGGVLDSPLVMRRESLAAHTPISPPPTLPTTTSALPDTDNELQPPHGDDRFESEASGSRHPLRCHGDVGCRLFSDSEDPSIDECMGLASLQLITPLSPEWELSRVSDIEPEASALLTPFSRETKRTVRFHKPRHKDRMNEWRPPSESNSPSSSISPSPPISPPGTIMGLSVDHGSSLPYPYCRQQAFHCFAPRSCREPETDTSLPKINGLYPQTTSDRVYSSPLRFPGLNAETPPTNRSSLAPLDIPNACDKPPYTTICDDCPDYDPMTVGESDGHSSVSSLTACLPNQTELDSSSTMHPNHVSDDPALQPPDSPPWDPPMNILSNHVPPTPPASSSPKSSAFLDFLDDIAPSSVPLTQSPSPSRRTFTSLPDLGLADDDPSVLPPHTPNHSSHHILALPGASPQSQT